MAFSSMNAIDRLLGPLRRKIMSVVARGVVKLIHNEFGMQKLQSTGLKGETMDDLEFFENYGFTCFPFEDSESLIVFPQANREHGIVIAVADRRYRLKDLEQGEVALYTDEGDSIKLCRGNRIEITTDLAVFSNDVTIDGDLIVKGTTLQKGTVTLQNADLEQTGISPEIRSTGSVLVKSLIQCEGDIQGLTSSTALGLIAIRNAYNSHNHDGQVPAPVIQM